MGEKEITLKERRIKDLEEYITLLESKGINKDDKEVIEDDLAFTLELGLVHHAE